MSEPRAKTAAELRDEFMDMCRGAVGYWAEPGLDRDCTGRLQGLLHSILCIIDGVTMGIHGFDLVAAPHSEAKEFHRGEGENWSEPGTVINGDVMLHEHLYERTWAHLKVT